jgi:predicted CopG family antitoxin
MVLYPAANISEEAVVSADKTTDAVKLNLRLPKRLHRQLVQQARRNNVSLNTEIVNQLEGSEAATAKRMADVVQPAVRQALEEFFKAFRPQTAKEVRERVRQLSLPDDIGDEILKTFTRRKSVSEILWRLQPRTEEELRERLERLGSDRDFVKEVLETFRKRQAAKEEQDTKAFEALRERQAAKERAAKERATKEPEQ